MVKPTKICFEEMYSDSSGVEYAVRFDLRKGAVEFEHINTVDFPLDKLDWLIERLQKIKTEIVK